MQAALAGAPTELARQCAKRSTSVRALPMLLLWSQLRQHGWPVTRQLALRRAPPCHRLVFYLLSVSVRLAYDSRKTN